MTTPTPASQEPAAPAAPVIPESAEQSGDAYDAAFSEMAAKKTPRFDGINAEGDAPKLTGFDDGEESLPTKAKEPPPAPAVDTSGPAEGTDAAAAAAARVEPPAPAAPAPPPTLDDLLAAVPEAQRGALKKTIEEANAKAADLDHKYRSAQGRIGKLESEVATRKAPAPAAGEKPSGAQKGPAELPRWTAFKKDYPHIAEAMEEQFSALAAASSVPQDLLEFVSRGRETALMQERINAVSTAHPDFVALVKAPEFDKWAEGQSSEVKELIESDNPARVAIAMTLYKAANPNAQAAPSPAPAASGPTPATPQADALRARRDAQRSAVEVPGGGSTLPPEISESDADGLFSFYAKRAEARRVGAR